MVKIRKFHRPGGPTLPISAGAPANMYFSFTFFPPVFSSKSCGWVAVWFRSACAAATTRSIAAPDADDWLLRMLGCDAVKIVHRDTYHIYYMLSLVYIHVQGRRQGCQGDELTPWLGNFSYFDHLNAQKLSLWPPWKSETYSSDPPWKNHGDALVHVQCINASYLWTKYRRGVIIVYECDYIATQALTWQLANSCVTYV